MSRTIPVIVLVLGAILVPWLARLFAVGRHGSGRDATASDPAPTTTPASGPQRATPDGPPPAHPLLQVRPDGVLLDWREQAGVPSLGMGG